MGDCNLGFNDPALHSGRASVFRVCAAAGPRNQSQKFKGTANRPTRLAFFLRAGGLDPLAKNKRRREGPRQAGGKTKKKNKKKGKKKKKYSGVLLGDGEKPGAPSNFRRGGRWARADGGEGG